MSDTPSFIPERLTEAREARGISISSLADSIGVSRQTIHNWERGTNIPSTENIISLSRSLNIPLSHWSREYRTRSQSTLFFRSLLRTPQKARTSSARKLLWLKRLKSFLERYVDLPQPSVPYLGLTNPLDLQSEDIESISTDLRSLWGLGPGPISDITLLLENHGVIISRLELQHSDIDAFSQYSNHDNTPYILVNSSKLSTARSRFDMSHELGHMVLHRHVTDDYNIDKNEYRTLEKQAHRFSSSFLMPESSFLRDIYNIELDFFVEMKRKWKTSVKSMIYRCKDLNILSEYHSRRLWIQYNQRGWGKGEPLDDSLEPEYPRLLKRAIELLVNEGITTPESILDALALGPHDIAVLTGIDPAFFRRSPLRLVQSPKIKAK